MPILLPLTAHRAQGYDMGLIAVPEKPEHVVTYGKHPAHQRYVSQLPTLILSTDKLNLASVSRDA